MNPFEYLQSELNKIQDMETERSFYPILKEFLIQVAITDLGIKNDVNVISEASSKVHESNTGFPDLTIQMKSQNFQTIGWIEVKIPKEHLDDEKHNKQFDRYKESLENVIFTNLREWQLWQWDEKKKPKKVMSCLFDAHAAPTNTKQFIELLKHFFEGKPLTINTPKQLALALARKTRLLSNEIEEELTQESSDFTQLKTAFQQTLIKDLKDHQFANMAAETLVYSFFLAALEHTKEGDPNTLTFRTAIDYLPKNVPILTNLYDLVSKATTKNESIRLTVEMIIEQFHKANMERIYKSLTNHKEDQDPTIYFYEEFLAQYDPKVREERGVYYTPKYVVNYMIRCVDELLQSKLNIKQGIDGKDVHMLDPATGTGTFLMSAIEHIYARKQKQFGMLGEDIVKREFARIVQNRILKQFYGFELLVAPYAIAHLKLTMLLEELGFDFSMTKDNDDPDDDRLKIYLANTLEKPEAVHRGQMDVFNTYKAISEESEKASEIKANQPVLVVVGNPPYSGVSSNMYKWIDDLLKIGYQRKNGEFDDGYYKVDGGSLGEKKLWLQDDYVKFIRFAQWKIDTQMDEGMIAFITNHGFLDNPTFRGMRESLMTSFNEIYVLNLHGNSKKKETAPDGSKDENVFAIQTGVCITFFVKTKEKKPTEIYSADLWGKAKSKEEQLNNWDLQSTPWERIKPKKPYYFFVKKDDKFDEEYQAFTKITNIFNQNVTGIVTSRDKLVIDLQENILTSRIKNFCDPISSDREIREKFFPNKKDGKYLAGDSRGWKLTEARKLITNEDHSKNITKINYRPFDIRHIYYHPNMVDWGRETLMKHMSQNNIALALSRQFGVVGEKTFDCAFLTTELMDFNFYRRGGENVFPLFLYEELKVTNLLKEFTTQLEKDVNRNFNLEQSIDIFDYIYGTLYLPNYRNKYVEQLKIDFPRIPIPSQTIEAKLITSNSTPEEAFNTISKFGKALRELHLLTHSIFEDTQKWNIHTGGEKPEEAVDWEVSLIRYEESNQRVYTNKGQYFEGIEPEVWQYHIGGYQVLDKWLKERKKANHTLSTEDLLHYMKIVVSLRETIKLTKQFE